MRPTAYYNEIDPFAAQWLRNLIAAGHIAPGDVDERSIEDVTPDDLRNYTQCHFFAGIGVWSYALRRAGWPDDKPVWTGSCPCQPFSAAGKKGGFADERHLWPAFHHLINQCRPTVVFGEQVASRNADAWFDLVQSDVEAMGYAYGLVPFPSAGIGAPHVRERAYWVADSNNEQRSVSMPAGSDAALSRERNKNSEAFAGCGSTDTLAAANCDGLQGGLSGGADAQREVEHGSSGCCSTVSRPLQVNGFWRDADWLSCRDGKWRPVEPGTFPLAYGITNRVGRLRAYGNAINAEAAKAFIAAFLDARRGN